MQQSTDNRALSYKFQRLREHLRTAIKTGELSGKLPGERELARRFSANAKTLSKALTDLAAEGLLDRSIGRGTFVKGSQTPSNNADRWLIVCPPDQPEAALVRHLHELHPDSQIVSDVTSLRPSFLAAFKAVIIVAMRGPDTFVRDLVVRSIPVVCVGCEPGAISTHVVAVDRVLATMTLARELMLTGHRRIMAIEPRNQRLVYDALCRAAERYAGDADIDSCFIDEVGQAVSSGATALITNSAQNGEMILRRLRDDGIDVPSQVSVLAMGSIKETAPCSGYFVAAHEKAQAIVELLESRPSRPVVMWLSGRFIDGGTSTGVATGITSASHTDRPRVAMML